MPSPASRLAIVTGTSSGIGEVLARQLVHAGWYVIGIARRPGSITGPHYRHLPLDLSAIATLPAALEAGLGSAVRDPALQRIGIVNNAADVALLGQLDRVDPQAMLAVYGTNTVAPIALAGWVLRTAAPTTAIRIVNVSSGAAVDAYPGLGSYGATKAALRMASMVLAAELDFHAAAGGPRRDITIWSYGPGLVRTPMQATVAASSPETMPIVQLFKDFDANGQLRPAADAAADIAAYLTADGHPRFSEQQVDL